MHWRILSLALLLSTLSEPVSAQLLVPLLQERSVEAYAELGLGGDMVEAEFFSAPDLGPFVQQAEARLEDSSQALLADAGAYQNSFLTGDRVYAEGSYFATVENFFTEASSASRCRFDFTLTEDALYTLVASNYAYDDGSTVIRLESQAGQVFFGSTAFILQDEFDYELTGFLPSGDYSLTIRGSGEVQDGFCCEYASGGYLFDMSFRAVGGTDCAPAPNSSGEPALLLFSGDHSVGSSTTYYTVIQGPPDTFGVLFYGALAPATPFGAGVLCVESPQYRIPGVRQLDAAGSTFDTLDYGSPPLNGGPGQVLPGSTWTFQFWFRDIAGTLPTWSTSSATSVTFG